MTTSRFPLLLELLDELSVAMDAYDQALQVAKEAQACVWRYPKDDTERAAHAAAQVALPRLEREREVARTVVAQRRAFVKAHVEAQFLTDQDRELLKLRGIL